MRKRTHNLRKPFNKLRFFKFLKKAETDLKYEEIDQKKRKPFNSKYSETNTKYSEIPQQF